MPFARPPCFHLSTPPFLRDPTSPPTLLPPFPPPNSFPPQALSWTGCAPAQVELVRGLWAAMTTSTTLSGRSISPRAPERGSFPLDHLGECREFARAYLRCMKEHANLTTQCRPLAKQFLACRMDTYVGGSGGAGGASLSHLVSVRPQGACRDGLGFAFLGGGEGGGDVCGHLLLQNVAFLPMLRTGWAPPCYVRGGRRIPPLFLLTCALLVPCLL